LRRFAITLEFRPLRPKQAFSMFARNYKRMAGRALHVQEAAQLEGRRGVSTIPEGDTNNYRP
jgi:hypothetical protein